MIAIHQLSYFLGDRPLFDEASLHIKPKDKIGLIGYNGAGKSTLLRLIYGEGQPSGGEINKSKECSIGFLNQDHLSYKTEESILSVALQAYQGLIDIQKQIDFILKEMEVNYEDKLVEKLTRLQEEFEIKGGYQIQSQAEEILEGIGFKTDDLQRPLEEFSGGWRMRVMLAKLLLEKPSLLMLDEPTNHLDLPSIQWIESYLQSYEGALLIVSHDRNFLDGIVNKIAEISGSKINLYQGNYTKYEEEKALRSEIQKNAYENQQQKIKQTERFIERFRAKSTKARQVQSKIKSLDRMQKVDAVVDDNASISFNFRFKEKSGRFVSKLVDISKSYDDLDILQNCNVNIERGDKIGLIGANGKGKSTLLRIIANQEKFQGSSSLGHNVNMSFYAQHQLEALNINNEVLEELKQFGSDRSEQELRQVLGCFLFSDDDVFKKIKVLSGGEKSRVALAKTLISEANFLLLDEPTNHLDIPSINILIQALQQYEGSFIIVSHDRHFVSMACNKIWYIKDKEIKEYPGTYEEYDYWLKKNEKTTKEVSPKNSGVKKEKVKHNTHKKDDTKIKQLQKEIEKTEKQIMRFEEDKEKVENQMSDPQVYANPDQLAALNEEYAKLTSNIEAANTSWEQQLNQLEELNGN